MSHRMTSNTQFGASSSTDFGSRNSSSMASSSAFPGQDPLMAPHNSSQSVSLLRKNAREVERRLGEAVDACSASIEMAPFDVVQRHLRDAQTLLEQLTDLNKALSKLSSEQNIDPAQSGTQYHQDKLRYYAQSYRRIKQSWEEKRQREELLHHAAHQRDGQSEDGETSIAMQTMMADSSSLASSNRTMNSLVEQGQEVKDLLIKGRLALESATSRIHRSIGAFASIDSAMRIIQRAKKKHTIILGIVIGICVCIFLWMML